MINLRELLLFRHHSHQRFRFTERARALNKQETTQTLHTYKRAHMDAIANTTHTYQMHRHSTATAAAVLQYSISSMYVYDLRRNIHT